MQAIADLQKQWRERERFRRLHAHLSLEKEGVVLGANTILAKRNNDGALDSNEARTFTLLAVAYGNPVDRSVLGKIDRASEHARAGNEAMAAMHIALAGLPVLRDPEDAAKRLFIADGLMEKGIAPRDIWTALEFDPAPLDALTKFNPDEPRVPAGSGRPSGRWTREGGDAPVPFSTSTEAPSPIPAGDSGVTAGIVVDSDGTAPTERTTSGVGSANASVSGDRLPIKLTYVPLHAPSYNRNGQIFSWPVRWQLSQPSPNGGYIVQRIHYVLTIPGQAAKVQTYWEAWHVAKGAYEPGSVGYLPEVGQNANYDDVYDVSTGIGPFGSLAANGSARYYDGLSTDDLLKLGFKAGNAGGAKEAARLLSTYSPPNLPLDNATQPVARHFFVKWP
jgi:hypothetical protein